MTKIAPWILWWIMTILVFGIGFMLVADGVTFLLGHEDETTTNTFQRFFGGSTTSWRAAMYGFLSGSCLVHFTRWGAIPPKLKDKG